MSVEKSKEESRRTGKKAGLKKTDKKVKWSTRGDAIKRKSQGGRMNFLGGEYNKQSSENIHPGWGLRPAPKKTEKP